MTPAAPLEILVEELSAEAALRILMPKVLPGVSYEIRVFRGKADLVKKLPQRLAGYAAWPGRASRIVVLIDRDDEDCVSLRRHLDDVAARAGFAVTGPARTVVNRIAVEELEAWFFGDIDAVIAAFPRVPTGSANKNGFRDPDAIRGGTWEALERLLQAHGYHRGGLAKVAAAQAIAAHMNIENNRSRSFQVFRDGVRLLAETGDA